MSGLMNKAGRLGAVFMALSCSNSGNVVTPPETPVPLSVTVAPVGHHSVAQQGTSAQGDSAAVQLSGDAALTAAWNAGGHQGWTALTTAAGTGSGMVRWTRNIGGLGVGVYIDTVRITVPEAVGSPYLVYDTLTITAAPVPLSLALSPTGLATSVTAGATSAAAGEAAVTINGTGAENVTWSATKRHLNTTLTQANGTGSGAVKWSRNPSGLGVGDYVDTITVSAPGVPGSPLSIVDTLHVIPAPVPLSLVTSPAARTTTVPAGSGAPTDSATVTLAGDGAATATWTATRRQSWTTLTTASGQGSGRVRWSRSSAGLLAGTYVDTITVTAPGAIGSPATIVDTLRITAVSGGGPQADLGLNASLHGKAIFQANNPWNQPVDTAQVDPSSAAILGNLGLTSSLHPDFGSDLGGFPFGIPYVVISEPVSRFTLTWDYPDESDPGPYPIPANPPIEGDGQGDAHLIVIHRDEWKLYEIFHIQPAGGGQWTGGSGAIFDLTNGTTRPAGWTSADAAGLPIFPGLVRYDEVYELGEIKHALRMTLAHTRKAYVPPASHWASNSTNTLLAPMGMRVRLKASFDISGYAPRAQVILRALKKYGMIVADNGSNFFFSGTADSRWDDAVNNTLKQVKVGDFEVVKMTGIVTP